MQCWICGAIADSREHMIKRTGLKLRFPDISQKKPIHSKRNNKDQKPAGGINANQFKYKKSICKKCNNERTKDFDNAWEKLSTYLFSNEKKIKDTNKINLLEVFSTTYTNDMILVQLFFAKIFGCKVVEYNIPIDLSNLAKAIQNKNECSKLYIELIYSNKQANYVVNSDIVIDNRNIFAHMYYTVGYVNINIIYTKHKTFIKSTDALKPTQMINILKIKKINKKYEESK